MPRRQTGIKRPYPIQVDVTKEEDEFIARDSFDLGLTKTEYIRQAMFSGKQLKEELDVLREAQEGIRSVWKKRKKHKVSRGSH